MVMTKSKRRLQSSAHVRILNDGVVSASDCLDNDGIEDQPLAIAVAIRVEGKKMVLDFSRSAEAVAGPVNISRSTAIAACYVALKHLFPDVPANAGVLDPIDIVIPEGSLLSATSPRPVGGYTETILRIIDVIFSAIGKIAPERALGNAYGTINALSLAGHRDDGSRWVMFSFFGGGHGGNGTGDGLSHGNAPISMATIPPLEIFEAAYPIAFRKWALRKDSGGPGVFRGGLGATYQIEVLNENAMGFFFGERGRHAPKGVGAGKSGALNQFSWQTAKGAEAQSPEMTSKKVGICLQKGGSVLLQTPGGGGFGDPLERPVDKVIEDYRMGYISSSQMRETYGVVLNEQGAIEPSKTEIRRADLRKCKSVGDAV